jgi:hypothetical protein
LDHLHAYETQAAERYVLGELAPAEAEEFELHFFECQQCAMALESTELFAQNARAVMRDQKAARAVAVEKKGWGFSSFFKPAFSKQAFSKQAFAIPMLAAAALAVIAIYQNAVEIPGMRQALDSARSLPAFQLIGASRGEGMEVRVPAGTVSFALAADIPPEAHAANYICRLAEGGKTIFEVKAPAPAEGQPITILVPVRKLQPGPQELSIYGSTQTGEPGGKVLGYAFNFNVSNFAVSH